MQNPLEYGKPDDRNSTVMSEPRLSGIHGLLFDLDGTLYLGDEPIAGASEAVAYARTRGIACRFVTNTSTKSAKTILEKMHRLGFDADAMEIFTPSTACVSFLRRAGAPRIMLFLEPDAAGEFAEFEQDAIGPDYVVVGDIGEKWDYRVLNDAFRAVQNGARLLAYHKSRYYRGTDGMRLDAGPFVAALEYAAGVEATVLGKPTETFFSAALRSLGLSPAEVAMVGDDVESDAGGAQAVGMTAVLVRTGKYRDEALQRSGVAPEIVLDSVAGLPALLPRTSV